MFKKIIPALFMILYLQTSFAQTGQVKIEKPDFKKIESAIKDKHSPFFYQNLMDRYTANDTSLSLEDYRYLYYGYSFGDKYSPYGRSDLNDELKKAVSNKETDKIIELEKKIIKDFPFNLRDLYVLDNTLSKKGETADAKIYHRKLVGVGRAILSTGNGLTDSTAMYVISVDHEYDMISLMGYKFGNNQALIKTKNGNMDKMKLEKNDEDIEYLYFNVDRIFANYQGLFKKD
jgi:hypothetical protein